MKDYLRTAVLEALNRIGLNTEAAAIQFERPKIAGHGDLSCNIAMVLAREGKRNPRQLAEELVTNLETDLRRIEAVEIAGPGFINFRFSSTYLYDELAGSFIVLPAMGRVTKTEGSARTWSG
jgi:arginyl-tRNA synthetase